MTSLREFEPLPAYMGVSFGVFPNGVLYFEEQHVGCIAYDYLF